MPFRILKDTVFVSSGDGRAAYIGLTDNITEHAFYWMDRQRAQYRNWNAGKAPLYLLKLVSSLISLI